MDITNSLSNNIKIDNQLIEKNQNSFLQSTLWTIIDKGINVGIRTLLPNFLEDKVIEIKDALFNNGLKEGAKKAITSAIDLGKKATGIITGTINNIYQAEETIKSGGLIDNISKTLNASIQSAVKNNSINEEIGNTIKKGNNVITKTIDNDIEKNFKNQISSLEKIENNSQNWKKAFKEQNFKDMEKEYKKIKENLKKVLPMEKTLKEARELENIHLLIKNNGQNFDISKEELELAKKLS
ncbi:MAG: hypothetical protein IKG14_05750 [Clostridia bacterium]|nr:hypothetical protein [Clostridia bacterium]